MFTRGFILLGCSLVALAGCGGGNNGSAAASSVPDILKAPNGNVVLVRAKGQGVQVYTATPIAADPTKFTWTLKAPEAVLLDDKGAIIGTHYLGPTWEANDGSKVVGTRLQSANSPDASAIPWLLLQAKSNEGSGTFSKVTYIQRTETAGGKAPADPPTAAGAEVRVHYTATYVFYITQ